MVQIIVAIIGCLALIIAASISLIPSLNKAPTNSPLSQITITTTPRQNMPSSIDLSTPTLGPAACQGDDIYFQFIDSKAQTLIKCLDERRIITLEHDETTGLVNLSGQIKGSAIDGDDVCDWEWSTNEDTSHHTVNGDCDFSIELKDNMTEIRIKLIAPNIGQYFFVIKIQTQ